MPKELVVLLLFFLVAFVVASELKYEIVDEQGPIQYYTPEETTDQVKVTHKIYNDSVNPDQKRPKTK